MFSTKILVEFTLRKSLLILSQIEVSTLIFYYLLTTFEKFI